jgi:hypothetical protein
MSERYVHEDVTLTCTNGFHTSKMLVKDRGVRIAGGKLIATYEDKPKDFACKWVGVLAAIVAAACIAAPFIIGVLAAFVIGMGVALTLGNVLCWIALRGATWAPVHSKVKIKGIHPLLSDSILTCPVFSGEIKFFYDAATANRQNHINQLKNGTEILGAAFMGRSFRMFANSIKLTGWMNASWSFGVGIGKSLVFGYVTAEANNVISNKLVDDPWNAGFGEAVTGDSKTTPSSYASANYQKPFTDPLFTEGEKDAIIKGDQVRGVKRLGPIKWKNQTGKMVDNDSRFQEYGQTQSEIYKAENPVHRYSRGRNSPFYGRQQGRQQKLNRKAREIGETKTKELSGRYENRISKEYAKNLNRADYGILAAFVLEDLIAQYEQKKLNKFGLNDEAQAKNSINVIANEH